MNYTLTKILGISLMLLFSYSCSLKKRNTSSNLTEWSQYKNNSQNWGSIASTTPSCPSKVKWNFPLSQKIISPKYAADTNHLFYSSNDNPFLYKIDIKTGENVWKFDARSAINTNPILFHNKIFIHTINGIWYAIDINTGKEVWQSNTGKDLTPYTPVGIKDKILLGGDTLLCLDINSMKIKWKKPYKIIGGLTANENTVVFSEIRSKLYSLDIETGQELWNINIQSWGPISPAIDKNKIVGVAVKKIYTLNAQTGQELWSSDIDILPTLLISPIITQNKVIYLKDSKNLCAWELKTGSLLWQFQTKGNIYSDPIATDSILLVTTDNKEIHCINAQSGQEQWHYQAQYYKAKLPALINNKLLIISDSSIYALE